MNILREPLTKAQIIERQDESGFIKGVVPVPLSSAIDNDLEGWLDIISEKLTGSSLLTNSTYTVVGFEAENVLLVEVSGSTEMLDLDDEGE